MGDEMTDSVMLVLAVAFIGVCVVGLAVAQVVWAIQDRDRMRAIHRGVGL